MNSQRPDSNKIDWSAQERLTATMRRGMISAWPNWRPDFITFDDILSQWAGVIRRLGAPGFPNRMNVYLSIPICDIFCQYCMYWRVKAQDTSLQNYSNYLISLLRAYRERLGPMQVLNGYVGGGTASILPASCLADVLKELTATFSFKNEVTYEVNPRSINDEKLSIIAANGFNRLSIGVQSFDETVLERIGRRNPPPLKIADTIRVAQGLGLYTNVDMITGLPGQDEQSFRTGLDALLDMAPDFITIYRYIPTFDLNCARDASTTSPAFATGIVSGSRYDDWIPSIRSEDHAMLMTLERKGSKTPFDPSVCYSFYDYPDTQLLGIGCGSYSHIYGNSWTCEVTPMDRVSGDAEPVFWGSRLTPQDEALTEILHTFADNEVCNIKNVNNKTGIDPSELLRSKLAIALDSGHATIKDEYLRISPELDTADRNKILDLLLPEEPADSPEKLRKTIEIAKSLGQQVPPLLAEGIRRRQAFIKRQLGLIEQPETPRVRAWLILMGIKNPGGFMDGAELISTSRDKVFFRPAGCRRDLCVSIQPPGSGNSYFTSRHFSISYVDLDGPPDAAETRLLEALSEKMNLIDP